MADYIFNVYLNTDMVDFKSEYFYNLPSFYFTINEYVSTRADISIPNSILTSRASNIFYGSTLLTARSKENCEAFKSIYNSGTIIISMVTNALVEAASIEYSNIHDYIWLNSYCMPVFTHV